MSTRLRLNKSRVKQDMLHALYSVPREQLSKAFNKLVMKMAVAQDKPNNRLYYVIYEGSNFFSGPEAPSWNTEEIRMLPEYLEEFNTLYKFAVNLLSERVIIANHITQILNSIELADDLPYLLNKNLHKYLPEYPYKDFTSKLAQDHAQYLKNNYPERDNIINERILTNVLIKNL